LEEVPRLRFIDDVATATAGAENGPQP
jgi:hypothetical protein